MDKFSARQLSSFSITNVSGLYFALPAFESTTPAANSAKNLLEVLRSLSLVDWIAFSC